MNPRSASSKSVWSWSSGTTGTVAAIRFLPPGTDRDRGAPKGWRGRLRCDRSSDGTPLGRSDPLTHGRTLGTVGGGEVKTGGPTYAEPADPRFGARVLRRSGRVRLPVLRAARPWVRLVRALR